jgi:hypothetical protein
VIIELQTLDDRRHGLARRVRQRIPGAVVIGQPMVDDRLRDRLTATAAHGARLPVNGRRKIDRSRYGLAAMVTIAEVHHCRIQEKKVAPANGAPNRL